MFSRVPDSRYRSCREDQPRQQYRRESFVASASLRIFEGMGTYMNIKDKRFSRAGWVRGNMNWLLLVVVAVVAAMMAATLS